jgi:hypothetical protein
MIRPILQRARTHVSAISGYAVLSLVLTFPLALNYSSSIPGDGFDGLQNYWNLWWVRRALLDLVATPFFTRELYYPNGASLYFHTLNIFNGLVSLPVQLLSGLAVAYNTTVLFTFVMSGYGAYLLARRVLGARARAGEAVNLISFVSGFIFAFAPFRFAHLLGHMQVLSTEWIPFFALSFLALPERRGPLWRRALLPALFLVLNGLCDWYYVLYLMIFCVPVVLWRWAKPAADGRPWSLDLRSTTRFLAPLRDTLVVGIIFAVSMSPILIPMIAEAASASYLRPPYEETILLSADLLAFVLPSEFHPWWGSAVKPIADQFTSSLSERTVFAGFAAIALAAAGAWYYRRRATLWALVLAGFFVLALGPYAHLLGRIAFPLPLPYAWLYQLVPLVRITRSVSRFDVMVMLSLAMLAALGLRAVGRHRRWVALWGVLISVEFMAIPYPLSYIDIPKFYDGLRGEQGNFAILELPINWDRPDPLLYQTVHEHPLISAYTSRSNPLSIVESTPVLNMLRTLEPDIIVYDAGAIGFSVLADLDVRYVVNHPLTMGAGDERTVTNRVLKQLFGARPPAVNEPNIVVYRVPPPEPYVPYLTLGEGWGQVELTVTEPQRVVACGTPLSDVRSDEANTCEANLIVHRRVEQPLLLRMGAHANGATAHVVISAQPTGGQFQRMAEFDLSSAVSVYEFWLPAADRLQLKINAPIVVESLELRAP